MVNLKWRGRYEKDEDSMQSGRQAGTNNEEYTSSNISIVCMREYLFGGKKNNIGE
jgi:hypothetical protein